MPDEYQSEIYKLLRIGEDSSSPAPQPVAHSDTSVSAVAMTQAPFDLPVVDLGAPQESLGDAIVANILGPVAASEMTIGQMILPKLNQPEAAKDKEPKPATEATGKASGNIKGLLMYPMIFAVAFAFFYVLLNFSSLVSQVNAWFNTQSEDEVVLQEDLTAFYDWMNGYYFAVGSKEFLEPANDIDTDGLSNYDEFVMRTNPTVGDSDLDGVSDGAEVINTTNPWGVGAMTKQQKALLEKIDIIKINNRLNFNVVSINDTDIMPSKIDYDLTKPGRLSIPKLNIQVPIIWTQNPKDFDADLTKGVVHYPGTALPGERGTAYVSGHSSDYLWKKHPYKQVFSRINALETGDDIFIDIYGLDGKTYNYRYRVSAENIYKPDDQAQFIDNSQAKLNLSTCWPIGTQKDRYVVSATLVPL